MNSVTKTYNNETWYQIETMRLKIVLSFKVKPRKYVQGLTKRMKKSNTLV